MVRAPREIPRDRVVECTDSMETPTEAAVLGVASLAVALYGATQDPVDSGGVLWIPVAGITGTTLLIGAAEGASQARECRAVKQRAAEIADEERRNAALDRGAAR
ncbi:MAG: hypothetical protein JO257_04685 [Deltaproteobacteria bacterium]|nr:hypothetical protein [Deltaproteobacteria bacterium]